MRSLSLVRRIYWSLFFIFVIGATVVTLYYATQTTLITDDPVYLLRGVSLLSISWLSIGIMAYWSRRERRKAAREEPPI